MRSLVVVEDDADLRQLLTHAFERDGWNVVAVVDGGEARTVLRQTVPLAVVTDLLMPRCNGAELIQWLREQEATRDVPVLVLTAVPAGEPLLRDLEGSAHVEVMYKPFRVADLRGRVRRLAMPGRD